MRVLLTTLMVLACAPRADASPTKDPSTGPWWKAPQVFLTMQTEQGDEARADGFLLPIATLTRSRDDGSYEVEVSSRRVLTGETLELAECSAAGRLFPKGPGRLSGSISGRGGVELQDSGGGLVAIRFERPGNCYRSGNYVGSWTAPH